MSCNGVEKLKPKRKDMHQHYGIYNLIKEKWFIPIPSDGLKKSSFEWVDHATSSIAMYNEYDIDVIVDHLLEKEWFDKDEEDSTMIVPITIESGHVHYDFVKASFIKAGRSR